MMGKVIPSETSLQARPAGIPDVGAAKKRMGKILQSAPRANEDDVKHNVRTVLESLFPNYPIRGEQHIGRGRADLICNNVIVETKNPNSKHDNLSSSSGIKKAEQQAIGYLDLITPQQKLFRNLPWRCLLTDGKLWLFYQYIAPDESSKPGRLHLEEQLKFEKSDMAGDIVAHLQNFVDVTASPPPPIGAEWITGLKTSIAQHAKKQKDNLGFQSKRNLWSLLLRGSHIIPPTSAPARDDLFAKHTLLIIIAKSVREDLKPAAFRKPLNERHKLVADGFASWLSATESGKTLIKNIIQTTSRYDWRTAGRDALKDLYHDLIETDLRHDFGEFYTPDWLADLMCQEVLDDDWCRKAIRSGKAEKYEHVVLDPSCGSGTFLFHACSRLLEFARSDADLATDLRRQAEIVSNIVYGFDIHPVAVELARATKLAALPHVPSNSNNFGVYIGDSLQWDATKILGVHGELVIIPVAKSKTTKHVRFPAEFLLVDDFEKNLDLFFDIVQMHPDKFDQSLVKSLITPQNTHGVHELAQSCKFFHEEKEAGRNHVWKTYLANMVQPFRMDRSADRMVGNPPWVTSRGMDKKRQEDFRKHAEAKGVWSGGKLAPVNDLSATFVASCVEYYLSKNAKFGFVLPHAATISDQWAKFRTGSWSNSAVHFDKVVDLRNIADRPFPTSDSSYFIGTHLGSFVEDRLAYSVRGTPHYQPLQPRFSTGSTIKRSKKTTGLICGITVLSATGVKPHMPLVEVRPLLKSRRKKPSTQPNVEPHYRVLMGANLQPHSLIVCDSITRHPNFVKFSTKRGKGKWGKTVPEPKLCRVESDFVHKALFSKSLRPFGFLDPWDIIGPFKQGRFPSDYVIPDPPLPDGSKLFNAYWTKANILYSDNRSTSSPATLLSNFDHHHKVSKQLRVFHQPKLVHNTSGSRMYAAVIPKKILIDVSLMWITSTDINELHYLCSLLNSPFLHENVYAKSKTAMRHFSTTAIKSLRPPKFNPANSKHSKLANLSILAHKHTRAVGDVSRANYALHIQDILSKVDSIAKSFVP